MNFKNFIFLHDDEPQTLTQIIEMRVKEFSYLENIIPQNTINLSPFKKREEVMSPSEYVSKFIKENFINKNSNV